MKNTFKVSIITVTWNSARTLQACINSVWSQSYKNREYIIIDGASNDGTLAIIKDNIEKIDIFKSEQDDGIYDALNKGFELATGDIIGILHSDDCYYDSAVLDRVVHEFENSATDYIYGDIQMIDGEGHQFRYWRPGPLPGGEIKSTQIPHPSLFLSRELINKIKPPFDSTYKIAADLKQQLIFANILRVRGSYLPIPLVKMRIGGASTANFKAYLDGWIESRRAWNEVHGSGGASYVIKKVLSKFKDFKG